jgi:hypothetical protein
MTIYGHIVIITIYGHVSLDSTPPRRTGVGMIDLMQLHWGDGLHRGYLDGLRPDIIYYCIGHD